MMLDRRGRGDGSDEEDERSMNIGFTHNETQELLCQGVKPWGSDADIVMAALHDY
jgi:hypothetical protein